MKETLFEMGISFKYPGRLIEKGMGARGHNAAQFIKMIKDIQKGNLG